ncbi:hypothetical protein EJB05_18295, partial [Eragrostis curvula]
MSPCPSAGTEERTTWGGGPLLELGLSESAPARVRAHGSAPDASSPLNASVPSRLSTMLIDAGEPTPSLAYPCRAPLIHTARVLVKGGRTLGRARRAAKHPKERRGVARGQRGGRVRAPSSSYKPTASAFPNPIFSPGSLNFYPPRFMLVLKINLLLCDDSFVR